jgi:hypothetical protein
MDLLFLVRAIVFLPCSYPVPTLFLPCSQVRAIVFLAGTTGDIFFWLAVG